MSLKQIELTNFRSYADRVFELGTGINLVVGPNASGKTNLLESLFVLAITKSFRARDYDLIRHNQKYFRVVGVGQRGEYGLAFSSDNGHQEKRASHNGVKKSLAQHIGTVQVVLFEPGDLDMVGGAPEVRRRYLDYVLCQTDGTYLNLLTGYRRVLRQRNALLADFNTARIKDEIFAWDIKLTELATEIHQRRLKLLEYLQPLAAEYYQQIAGGGIDLRFQYLPSVELGDDSYADRFMSALAMNLTRDLGAGFTTIGPHREDFKIFFGSSLIPSVASRGEVRTVILAMKLAELNYCERMSGNRPILLLDDVFSELDYDRRQDLLARLEGHQSIITTTEADSIRPQIKGDYQLIETGKVKA